VFVKELSQGEERGGGEWGGGRVQVECPLPTTTGEGRIPEFSEDSIDSEGTSIAQVYRISTE